MITAAPTSATVTARRKKPTRRWLRRLGVTAGVGVVGLGGLWIAMHEFPEFGAAVADAVRSVVGPGAVAWAEDTAYGAADRVNLALKSDDPPKIYWGPDPGSDEQNATQAPGTPPEASATSFQPPAFSPPFPEVAATGDGEWLPMPVPGATKANGTMFKSLVHPDPKRPFAAVAVVAIDLRRAELKAVAGLQEPKSLRVHPNKRHGLIPEIERTRALAAFNGGFKSMHGNYGMMVDGNRFLQPRKISCTVAIYRDSTIRIRTWPKVEDDVPEMAAYRQTPPCLVEDGAANPALLEEFSRNWGATVSGETIIRRSAIGISKDGSTLFYGLGDAVTAQSIGRAMQVVGAHDAAQLDVNLSYPRFVVFDHSGDVPELREGLIPELPFHPGDYTATPARRDFFYLIARESL